ncbi:MAG: glycosyltransferase family 39 protein [Anaerolineales bacterium]|nr:glycosyltransferase family 39 protein [Anaerolineales bacterium]
MENFDHNKQSSLISDNSFKIIVMILAVCIGMIVRYPYFVSKNTFPLGDGGLFVNMIYAIKSNHYLLPYYVNYNSYQIPFAYPPLGFYFALISSKIFGESVLRVVQILPVVVNLLAIATFVLLTSELTKDRVELLLASGIFSIVFQVYQWTVKGGGLSRSPGLLFTILTLYFFLLYQRKGVWHYLFFSAFVLGLTLMSHLEWALIAVTSCFVFALGAYKTKRIVFDLLILGLGAAFVSLPWWGTVIYRFGTAPFVSAWNVAKMDAGQFSEKFFAGSMFSIIVLFSSDYFLAFLGMVGFASALLYRRNFFLPAWLLATYIVAPKNSPISGLLPLTILIAIGLRSIDNLVSYFLLQISCNAGGVWQRFMTNLSKIPVSIIYLAIIILSATQQLVDKPMLKAIKPIERTAMEYLEKNTPQDAKFVVLTQADWYSADTAEWFPYLTKRQSLTTPQGLEWVSVAEFNDIANRVFVLSQMVRNEQSGLEQGQLVKYVETHFDDYGFVAIFADNLEYSFGGFFETGRYEIFYRKKDVLIFRVVPTSN